MSRPLIGVSVHPVTAPDRNVLDLLLAGIVRGVERAGGLPVLIPLELGEETLRGLFARLEGVLIPGGGDIDPVEEDTLLARVLGQPLLTVNSLHHQACRDLAPGLRVTARAPDGVIEAVEATQHPFALAVQWHPECLLDAPEMLRLFEAFVQAARKPSPSSL